MRTLRRNRRPLRCSSHLPHLQGLQVIPLTLTSQHQTANRMGQALGLCGVIVSAIMGIVWIDHAMDATPDRHILFQDVQFHFQKEREREVAEERSICASASDADQLSRTYGAAS